MALFKNTITSTLESDLPGEALANSVAHLLPFVNQWSTQIPAMLEGPVPSNNANLIFSIRKELFKPPQFTTSVFGIALADLPTPFQEFVNFIRDLQDAQKVERERPAVVKVGYSHLS